MIQAAAAIVTAQVTLLSYSHYEHFQPKIKSKAVVGCHLIALFCGSMYFLKHKNLYIHHIYGERHINTIEKPCLYDLYLSMILLAYK